MFLCKQVLPPVRSPPVPGTVNPIRAPAQGNLPQSRKILNGKIGLRRRIFPLFFINRAAFQAFHQLLRLNIYQFHLICPVKHIVRNPVFDTVLHNCGRNIAEAFNVLGIYCRVDVNSRFQKLLHVLIPSGMAAPFRIRPGQLVHQNQLRTAQNRRIQVKFSYRSSAVAAQLLQSVCQRCRFRHCMRRNGTNHHIDSLFPGRQGCLKHRVGLSHACGVPEKDFQTSPFLCHLCQLLTSP
ncbi:putative uncharacterized protein [Clostridium sp. CAG:299]|nr:putative uncharacterized protein [Clostridium sp. CAG:299]